MNEKAIPRPSTVKHANTMKTTYKAVCCFDIPPPLADATVTGVVNGVVLTLVLLFVVSSKATSTGTIVADRAMLFNMLANPPPGGGGDRVGGGGEGGRNKFGGGGLFGGGGGHGVPMIVTVA
jgi:hypothetical protein